MDYRFLKPHGDRPLRDVILFFGLTFLITWGLGAFYLVAPERADAIGGPGSDGAYNSWLFYVAVYAPTISALALLFIFQGPRGLVRLVKDAFAPGRPLSWLAWILIGYMILPVGWIALSFLAAATGLSESIGAADPYKLFVAVPVLWATTAYVALDPGPIGEEPGWRGYAMPRLLLLMHPILAGLILGVLWGVWHLPAFLIAESAQSEGGLSFIWFCVSLASQGVLMTWIYLRSKGNWLAAGVLPHLAVNASASKEAFTAVGLMYPLAPLIWAVLICVVDPVMRRRIRLDEAQ